MAYNFPTYPIESTRERVREAPTRHGPPGLALIILSAVAAALAVPSNSYADSIMPAVFSVSAAGGQTITTPGTVLGSECNLNVNPLGGCQSSAATATYGDGLATVSASASTVGLTGVPAATADAEATFSFLVQGLVPPGTKVPLIFTGFTNVQFSDVARTNNAVAEAVFSTPGGAFGSCIGVGSFYAACASPVFQQLPAGSIPFAADPATAYSIDLRAHAYSDSGNGSYTAVVDPEVTIDPSFIYLNSVSLVFSPNVSSPVPEPSAFLMLGSGLLGLAPLLRRIRLRSGV